MKLELAPCHEEYLHVSSDGLSLQNAVKVLHLNSILTGRRHLEPIFFLPLIMIQLFSKT